MPREPVHIDRGGKPSLLPRLILALVLLLLVIAPIFSNGVDLIVDWLWFKQEGFRVIYATILQSQIALSGLAGIGFMAAVSLNLLIARGLAGRHGHGGYREGIELPILDRFRAVFRWLIWIGVLLLGYLVGEWASGHWFDYLLWQHPQTLGQSDPLFGRDLGCYLFQLSFHWFAYHLGLLTLIVCLLGAAFLYLVEGGVWVTGRGLQFASGARSHLLALGGPIFVVFAYRARLAQYGLLYSRGLVYGAGYTDVHANLPVLKALGVLCLLTAVAFFWSSATGRLRAPILMIVALLAVALGGQVYPEFVQRVFVAPNEIEKERPYIEYAVKFTRQAYGLDRFEEREFSAVENLKLDDIVKNEATIHNVRLWDHKPLLTTFAQLQEIRTYYDFRRVDNDRYLIHGVYRQVSLSPRELSASSLPSRNWINEHLTYTHGYGLCLGPVNESSREGLPELFIKDIPPVSTIEQRITRPEIYYGELTNDYCFVRTHAQEFDYPAGDQNVYTNYQGSGGIPVEGFWRRVLFALKFGEPKVLLSSDIRPESRLMIYRRVLERASRLTPFLRFDHDPYMVIAQDGSLVWMLDGYTVSHRYPYSDPTPGAGNYIRNSVKATVSAYTGETRFYVSDPSDPLIQAYARIFPGVFEPLSSMPADLRAHIRYPEDFFTLQASKYALFHMTEPRVFYNKEDLWRIASSAAGGNAAPMTPYYTIMKLAGVGTQEEFILMVPFTPARKDNMIAWMAARCDEANYGKVLVFTFPKQKLVYGPQQIESRVDQDPAISPELTLWDQHGSKVIRGTLLVTPVMNSILYVEPLYLAAEAGGGLPQLKRVIVAYSDHVVMENTLDAALGKIFGGTVGRAPEGVSTAAAETPSTPAGSSPPSASEPSAQTLIREANQHFERAHELLRQGDWAGYGQEMKKVGEVLKRMSVSR